MGGTQTPPPAASSTGGRALVQQLGGSRNVALGAGAVGVVALGLYKRSKAKATSAQQPLAGSALGFVPSALSDVSTDPSQVYTGYDQIEEQIQALMQQMNERGPNPNPVPTPIPVSTPGGPVIHGGSPPGSQPPVPVGGRPPVVRPPIPTGTHPPVPTTYTVQRGDTLWGIAQRKLGAGTAWKTLYQDNRGVIGSNPDLIRPGERLRVP